VRGAHASNRTRVAERPSFAPPAATLKRADANLHGVLVVDKPIGPTSHDVVARLRRALGTRRVGHAGTLDPGASGVLVTLIGEATKLSPYLTANSKVYAATITFGVATNTWDADGDVVACAPLAPALSSQLASVAEAALGLGQDASSFEVDTIALIAPDLARALDAERQRVWQVPPAFSAIKQQGETAHRLARRGQEPTLAARPVSVLGLRVAAASEQSLGILLHVSKGYYVRAFANDLGVSLGVPAHLSALRRLASGCFAIEEACSLSAPSLQDALLPIGSAVRRAMPCAILTREGAIKTGHGQLLDLHDFAEPPASSPAAWFDPSGEVTAVGSAVASGGYRALRGFRQLTSNDET
jgi:tRNA pseudouridine55 synthase